MPTALQGSPLLRTPAPSPRPCKTSPVAHSAPATRASLAGLPTCQAATVPRTFARAVSSAWNSVPSASTWPTLSHHSGTFLKGLLLHDTRGHFGSHRKHLTTLVHVEGTLWPPTAVILQASPCAGLGPVLPTSCVCRRSRVARTSPPPGAFCSNKHMTVVTVEMYTGTH